MVEAMTAYQRGNYREVKAMRYLEAHGYTVWQARGSHGAADLIALRRDARNLLVQVKTTEDLSGGRGMTHGEWNKLYRLADKLGAVPLVATCLYTHPGAAIEIHWTRILDLHSPNSRNWPSRLHLFLGQ